MKRYCQPTSWTPYPAWVRRFLIGLSISLIETPENLTLYIDFCSICGVSYRFLDIDEMSPGSSPERSGIKSHRIPEKSVFFNKFVPVLLILLGVATVALILFAIGVLTGIVHWA